MLGRLPVHFPIKQGERPYERRDSISPPLSAFFNCLLLVLFFIQFPSIFPRERESPTAGGGAEVGTGNKITHTCTVSLASLAILALSGSDFFMMREMLAMGRNRSCSLNSSVSTMASSAILFDEMIQVFSDAASCSCVVNGNCRGSTQKVNGDVHTTGTGVVASTTSWTRECRRWERGTERERENGAPKPTREFHSKRHA